VARYVLARAFAVGFLLVAAGVAGAAGAGETATGGELGLPPGIASFLDDPWPVFEGDSVPGGFRIIVLSQIAEACADRGAAEPGAREEAASCASRCAELALDRRLTPGGLDPARATNLGDHGLYSTHLLLVLGAAAYLGAHEHDGIAHRLASQLASASLADPLHHVSSFAGDHHRWPADQAATLHALWGMGRWWVASRPWGSWGGPRRRPGWLVWRGPTSRSWPRRSRGSPPP